MGQYHRIGNLDRNEYLDPWTFDHGAKLMEWGSDGGGITLAWAILSSCSNGRGGGDLLIWTPSSDDPRGFAPYGGTPTEEQQALYDAYVGRWAGERVAVIGDYAKPDDLPDDPNVMKLWQEDSPGWTDISADMLKVLALDYYTAQDMAAAKRQS